MFKIGQYELLALKELAQKKLIGNLVIPVVEPIKMSSTFDSTIDVYKRQVQLRLPEIQAFLACVSHVCLRDPEFYHAYRCV